MSRQQNTSVVCLGDVISWRLKTGSEIPSATGVTSFPSLLWVLVKTWYRGNKWSLPLDSVLTTAFPRLIRRMQSGLACQASPHDLETKEGWWFTPEPWLVTPGLWVQLGLRGQVGLIVGTRCPETAQVSSEVMFLLSFHWVRQKFRCCFSIISGYCEQYGNQGR